MNVPKLETVGGAAGTTFLLAGAATIKAMTATIGGEIGPGIVGVFVGVDRPHDFIEPEDLSSQGSSLGRSAVRFGSGLR